MPLAAPLSEKEPYTVEFSRDEAYKNKSNMRHRAKGSLLHRVSLTKHKGNQTKV
jgi:hypothetical protein